MMLNENIRDIRKTNNMTQEQLAEVMGVSTASVSKWETGQSAPEISALLALADYFDVSVDTLLGHEVKADRKKSMLEEMDNLAGEQRFDEATAIAGKLLRNYPNNFDVVEAVSNLYYKIQVCTGDRSAMEYSINLVHRLFALADDFSGAKRFELLSRLGNRYELLQDYTMSRKYYEESNVNGMNDRALAYLLAAEKQDIHSVRAISNVFLQSLFYMLTDIMKLSELWGSLGCSEKARAALDWGINCLESCGSEIVQTYASIGMAMHLSLAGMEIETGNMNQTEEHIRKAIRLAGRNVDSQDSGFLSFDKPTVISSQELHSPEALVALLQAMGLENFVPAARDELTRLQTT